MTRFNKLANVVYPLALLGVVGCTIVTNPKGQGETPPPPPPPPPPNATATAAPTPAPTPAPTAQPTAPKQRAQIKFNKKRTPIVMRPRRMGLSAPAMTGPNAFGSNQPQTGGLTGMVYFLEPNTSVLPDLSKIAPSTVLYTTSLNVASRDFKEGFPGVDNRVEWFGIRFTGGFDVAADGEYKFRVVSDDGARVYIDGALLIENDGIHPAQERLGIINLSKGRHALKVDYFQGPKWKIALQLFVTGPDGQEKPWSPSF